MSVLWSLLAFGWFVLYVVSLFTDLKTPSSVIYASWVACWAMARTYGAKA